MALQTPSITPSTADLAITDLAMTQDGDTAIIAITIVNDAPDRSYQDSSYTLQVQDTTGVIAILTQPLVLMLAGDRTTLVELVPLTAGTVAQTVSGRIQPGAAIPTGPSVPVFLSQDLVYHAGPPPQVSGTLLSNYQREATHVRVSAVAWDAADRLVGGGTLTDVTLLASGQRIVTVPMRQTARPARVELWAMFTPASFGQAP